MKDYKGFELCEPCWNNKHNHRSKEGKSSVLIIDCRGGKCECPCRELVAEKAAPKIKRDKSLQMLIDMTNPLVIGDQHDDRG